MPFKQESRVGELKKEGRSTSQPASREIVTKLLTPTKDDREGVREIDENNGLEISNDSRVVWCGMVDLEDKVVSILGYIELRK